MLTAVVDGELIFGTYPGIAVGRAAVTGAPDGTRWVGLSALRMSDDQHAVAAVQRLCEALLAWGAEHGASRGYVRVFDDDATGGHLFDALGFRVHHRGRYLAVRPVRRL